MYDYRIEQLHRNVIAFSIKSRHLCVSIVFIVALSIVKKCLNLYALFLSFVLFGCASVLQASEATAIERMVYIYQKIPPSVSK